MRKGYESISEFIFMEDEIEKADVILVPGGSRKELILKAAELYKNGYGKYILPSGGFNIKITDFDSEHEFLKHEALKLGIPESAILREDKAANTFENAKFSLEVLKSNNIEVKKAILVCKGFHSRRAYLTYKSIFPKSVKFIVQPLIYGENITKDNWFLSDDKINLVMGEVVKIGKYFKTMIKYLI